jgi:chitin disaccharide deacetylase
MMKTGTIYLVTKADDLGSNGSANKAFVDAFTHGILKNGVIMMPCKAAVGAASLFKDAKGFCMGLHLTMNAEWDRVKWGPVLPVREVPSLVDESGHFFQSTQKLRDNKPCREELLAEMQAQLELARACGLDIRFVDLHMGFSWVLDGLNDDIAQWCRNNGLRLIPDDLRSLPETDSCGDPVEKLISRLQAAESGVYFHHFGHPAYDWPEMRLLGHAGYEGVAEEREWDRKTLMDDRIMEYCRNNSVLPVTLEEALGLV